MIQRQFFILLIVMTFCRFSIAAERFVVIGEAEAPDILATSRSFGMFAEKFVPGAQIMIIGTVVALSFDPRLSRFDISSRIRISCHGDTSDSAALPALALMTRCRGSRELPPDLRLWKKGPAFPVKAQGKNLAVSTSGALLDALQDEYAPFAAEGDDLVLKMYPSRYIQGCPGNVPIVKEYIENAINAKNAGWELPDSETMERVLRQIKSMTLNLVVEGSQIKLSLDALGTENSEFVTVLAALPDGEIDIKTLSSVVKRLAGDNSFDPVSALDSAIYTIFSKIFPNSKPKTFEGLCSIRASHDKTSMRVVALLTQTALEEALTKSGIDLPPHR